MECERYSGIPCGLENRIWQRLAVGAVIPLREIGIAGGVFRRWLHLDAVDAATTFEP